MRNLRNFILIAIFALGVMLVSGTAQAQSSDQKQFPNGLVVRGDFLRFYNSAANPLLIFGYPISGEMEMNGKRVQYFDRARFEQSPTGQGSKVTLANLGWSMFDEANITPVNVGSSATCRYFPKYGHSVCFNFLTFYDTNNGPTFFGEPRSDLIQLNGQIVQYFDNARLEWQPNSNNDLHIGLTNVGRVAMQKFTGSSGSYGSDIIGNASDFTVKAFVEQALVAPGEGNNVYVVVQTPALKPIPGASVSISAILKDGEHKFASRLTNVDGISEIQISGLNVDSKQIVELQVTVDLNSKIQTTTTWYRIWY